MPKSKAHLDDLTGLLTRAAILRRMGEMIEKAPPAVQKFAVFYIDLDKFKALNDTYGHACGDWLLQSVAKRLAHVITDTGVLSRLGGDEFLLVAPITALAESAAIAHRLIKALETEFVFNDAHVSVSTSIGISIYPDHGEDTAILMDRADQALYRAKHQGRNNYQFFSTTIDAIAKKAEVLKSSLHQALDKQDFTILYQPQQNLQHNCIGGVEALVCLPIPGLGVLSSEKLYETANEANLTVKIEQVVWKLVLSQVQTWREKDLPRVPVTLRFSPKHFVRHNLAEKFSKLLTEAGLEPDAVMLKYSMSSILHEEAHVLPMLRHLKGLGFRVVLDGIGRPYLDLFKLKSMPLHAIVIDEVLLWEAMRDEGGRLTVEWLIRLARHLGLRTVGDGVETAKQLELLKSLGCDTAQGLACAPLLTAEEFAQDWLATSRFFAPNDAMFA